MSQRPLRLGTRRSLLARAQSSAIARALERAHPGLAVELVGIDTRGDRILDVPLSQVDGKEFFTAEIDAALRAGSVDLTVHSYKDLSLERPAELYLGAVPRRENPRDIVFFAADVRERLAVAARAAHRQLLAAAPGLRARIPGARAAGTRSRRAPRVSLCELRGNVDTRLRRLREARGSERALDGVMLAFAGLVAALAGRGGRRGRGAARAARRPAAHGAAADACARRRRRRARSRSSAGPTTRARARCWRRSMIRRRALAIAAERALLAERGGGCHQRFGATQVQVEGLGAAAVRARGGRAGCCWRRNCAGTPPAPPHARCAPGTAARSPRRSSTSLADAAAECARRLAQRPRGLHRASPRAARNWRPRRSIAARTSGCRAPRPGLRWPRAASGSRVAPSRSASRICAATDSGAAAGAAAAARMAGAHQRRSRGGLGRGAGAGDLSASAQRRQRPRTGARRPRAGTTQVWWHSGVQFERWRGTTQLADCQHACGPGKTAESLRTAGVTALSVFPSVHHWREWLRS